MMSAMTTTINYTLLFSATFVSNLTITTDLSAVYRLVESYTDGASLAEYVGTLADISHDDYEALASDDRARCRVAA